MDCQKHGADYFSAPANYAEFFRLYRSYVVYLVKRQGIEPKFAEDIASEIMVRFMERDMLAMFDSTLSFKYKGEWRPAKFRSFLSKIVILYCKGHRAKLARRHRHEFQLVDVPPHPDGNLWIDAHHNVDTHEPDVIEGIVEDQLVARLREYLLDVPRRSEHDSCDLVGLFDVVVDQIRETGTWNIADLRRIFGISSTAMHTWMWNLRHHIAQALNRPAPMKRVRTDSTPRSAT